MLTQEDNDRLCRVGPGTPMGNLMRRYWHPVATEQDLEREEVLKVRLLGEDLALYRSTKGKLGLIQARCPHRSASLVYGIPEDDGIRCAYHGWYFNEEGRCLNQPYDDTANPQNSFKDRIKVDAYAVQVMGGLVWAYLGPQPAPVLPRLSRFVNDKLTRTIQVTELPCNYLQVMENSMDPSHFEWLHANRMNYTARKKGLPPMMTPARTLKLAFDQFEYGIYKRRIIEGDPPETSPDWQLGHPVLFPTSLGLPWGFQIRVPMDDEHTLHFSYNVREVRDDEKPETIVRRMPYNTETGEYILDTVMGTDMMAWITPGPISPRHLEHLGLLDRGIIEYRQMLMDNVARVERGEEPMGLLHGTQDTYSYHTEGDMGGGWRGFTTPNPGAANNPAPVSVATTTTG